MTPRPEFGDDVLTAYLDDEASDRDRAEIDAARRLDPTLDDRLRRLEIDRAAIGAAFDGLLNAAPAAPDLPSIPKRGFVADLVDRRAVAAALIGGILTAGGLFGASRFLAPPSGNWQDQAVAYHALYVTQTLTDVQTSPVDTEVQLRRVSDALGKEIPASSITGLAGLSFKRAQVLGFEGRPLIQIAFLADQGAPVALCIYPSGQSGVDMGVSGDWAMAMATVEWARAGFQYLLVGGRDQEHLRRVAQELSATL